MYAGEEAAARAAGFGVQLIDHDAATAGDYERAVRGVEAEGRGRRFLYRGWMLMAPAYRGLIDALGRRQWIPISSSQDYEYCHHLVGWARALGHLTPRSEWIPHPPPFEPSELATLLTRFDGPAIVKDYVKTEKHAWEEACFIPDTRDRARAMVVIRRFLELRGSSFEGGLVIRDFVKLKPDGVDARSGMPLSRELRSYWAGTHCVAISDYWHNDPTSAVPPIAEEAAHRINRPFFTIDLAMTVDGAWIVIEVGDGQVSALPDSLSPESFYAALRGHVSADRGTVLGDDGSSL